jgi:ribose transport system substrate-binding protein
MKMYKNIGRNDSSSNKTPTFAAPGGGVSRRTFLGKGAMVGGAAALGLAAPELLAACSSSSTTSTTSSASGKSAASYGRDSQLIVHTPDNLYFQQWILGYQMACSALGLSPHVGYSNDDNATELSVLSTALDRGAKYINTVGPSDAVIAQVAQACGQQKAWLSDAFASPPWKMIETFGPYYRTYNQSPDFLLTYNMGKRVFNAIGGTGKVIHILGIPGQGISYLRAAGYQQAAKEFPGIEIVAQNYGYFDRVHTEPLFAAMFEAHPDIKAVVNASDDSNIGCISVLQSRNVKDVLLTSIDAIPEFLTWMEKGQYAYATGSILGTWMGAWLVVQNYDAAHGVQLNPLERQVTFGSIIIEGKAAASAYSNLVLNPASAKRIYDPLMMSRHLHPTDWQPQNSLQVMNPLDKTGAWVPEALAGYGHEPTGWAPPADWTKAAANGGMAQMNSALATAAARNDPLASIRGLVGSTIL